MFFAPLLLRVSTHILADDGFIRAGQSDAYTSLWTYWWIQKALLTGHDILHCTWVLPPTGAGLLFHTTSLVPTLLSLPFAKLFGIVTGYNLMVVGLIVGAAWTYYLFLSGVLSVSRLSAFWTGALFGFCPYFLFKTHAHINLVGACFWGGALAILMHAYFSARFGMRRGILFALLLWATF